MKLVCPLPVFPVIGVLARVGAALLVLLPAVAPARVAVAQGSALLFQSGFEGTSFAADGWSLAVAGSGSKAELVTSPVFAGAQAGKFTTTTQANGEQAFAERGFAWPTSNVVVAETMFQPQVNVVQYHSKVFALETRGPHFWTTRAGFALGPGAFGVIYTTRDGSVTFVDLGRPYANGRWYALALTVDYRGPSPVLRFAIDGQDVFVVTDTTRGGHTDRPQTVRVGFGPGSWSPNAGSTIVDEVRVLDASASTPAPTLTPTPTGVATSTPTATATIAPTSTPTATSTPADTATPTNTATATPAADTSAPVIGAVQATGVLSWEATISWTTDEPADGQVEYGPTTAYGLASPVNGTLALEHSHLLLGLDGGTTYHYRVRSRDAAGNLAVSGDFTFTTAPSPAPTSNPLIVNPPGWNPKEVTVYRGAAVVWRNDATIYHTTTSDTGVWDSGPLAPGQSFAFTFTTPGYYHYHCSIHPTTMGSIRVLDEGDPADTTAPAISAVQATAVGEHSATITWTTDEVADGQVEYGPTAEYGTTTTLDPALVVAHSVQLTGLAPDTTYHYRVRSRDASGNLGTSPDGTFTTAPSAVITSSGFEEASFAAGGWSLDVVGSGSKAELVTSPVFAGAQAGKFTTTTQANGEQAFAERGFAWPTSNVVFARTMLQPLVSTVPLYTKVLGLETYGPNSWATRAGFALGTSTFGAILTTRDGSRLLVDLGQPYSNGAWYDLAVTVDYRSASPVLRFFINGAEVYNLTDTTIGTHTDRPAAFRVGFGPGAWSTSAGATVFDAVVVQDGAGQAAPATPTPTPAGGATPTPTAMPTPCGGTMPCTPTPTATSTPTPAPTSTPTATPTPVATPTPTPTSGTAALLFQSGFEGASFAADGWSLAVAGSGSKAELVTSPVFAGAQAGKFTTTTQASGEQAFVDHSFTWPGSDVVTVQGTFAPQVTSVPLHSKVFALETQGPGFWTSRAGFAIDADSFDAIYTTRDGTVSWVDLGVPYANGQWYRLQLTVDYRGSNPILRFAINGADVYVVNDATTGAHTDRPRSLRLGFGPGAWGTQAGSTVFDEVSIQDPSPPTQSDPAAVGEWSSLLQWPIEAVHSILLKSGEVLIWTDWELGSTGAQTWNPATQTFTLTQLQSLIFCAGHAMLPDGRVLVVGGHGGSLATGAAPDVGIKDANIFDPATRTWTRVADLHTARWYPGVITLADGRVLAVGGTVSASEYATTPEIYDPATNAWLELSGAEIPGHAGQYPQIYLLPSGKVFFTNGLDRQTLLLDLATRTWTSVGQTPMLAPATVMYRPGKLLATGEGLPGQPLAAVIDFNEPAPTWRQVGPPAYTRYNHNLVLLPDGRVLVVGGSDASSNVGVLPAELWDPESETWTTLPALTDPRMYHSTALLLPDGRVLTAGGELNASGGGYTTAQIYSPAYLFRGTRPTITGAPSVAGYGQSLAVQTPDANDVGRVSLIRLGANTHNYDMDQRYLELSFTRTAGGLTVQTPANSNLAPPGYYLLFIVNSSGVPSAGALLQIGPGSP